MKIFDGNTVVKIVAVFKENTKGKKDSLKSGDKNAYQNHGIQ